MSPQAIFWFLLRKPLCQQALEKAGEQRDRLRKRREEEGGRGAD